MPNTTITWDTWWSDTTELLHYPFVHHALLAAALLGIISGLIAPLIVMRRMSFTVHGTSELALMGRRLRYSPGLTSVPAPSSDPSSQPSPWHCWECAIPTAPSA